MDVISMLSEKKIEHGFPHPRNLLMTGSTRCVEFDNRFRMKATLALQ
jgi:hypothetical protein